MVKKILLLLLLLSGPVSLGQDLADDAITLKNKRRDLWYADSSFIHAQSPGGKKVSKAQKRTASPELLKKVIGTLSYIIGGLILAALVYAFYNFIKTQKRRNTKTQETGDDNIETAEGLYEADFTPRIKAAETAENFRQALRYHYLRLLQEFSKQSLIRYEKNKTNQQYAEEIKNHKWGPDFRLATRYYNFVWYGEHPLDEESYHRLVSHFKKMLPHE